MGVEAPETYRATHKRQVINLVNHIWLVNLFELLLLKFTVLEIDQFFFKLKCIFRIQ